MKIKKADNKGFLSHEKMENPISHGDYYQIKRISQNNIISEKEVRKGTNICVSVMSIPMYGEAGVQNQQNTDLWIRVEDGEGVAYLGKERFDMNRIYKISPGEAVFVPRKEWYNIVNTKARVLKMTVVKAL